MKYFFTTMFGLVVNIVFSQCYKPCIADFKVDYSKKEQKLVFQAKVTTNSLPIYKMEENKIYRNIDEFEILSYYCSGAAASFDRTWDTVKLDIHIPLEFSIYYKYHVCGYPPDNQPTQRDSIYLNVTVHQDSSISFEEVTSIEKIFNDEPKIYLNSITNVLQFEGITDWENANYQIINSTGKLIKKGIIKPEIDVSSLTSGIYLVQVIKNEEFIVNRIYKE